MMPVPVYPTDPMWDWASAVEHTIPVLGSVSEANYYRSRRLSTHDRQEWSLSYKTTTAKWNLILEFWRSYAGMAVSFVSPDGESMTAVLGGTISRTKQAGYEVFKVTLKQQ
jgi:hypothetical protein